MTSTKAIKDAHDRAEDHVRRMYHRSNKRDAAFLHIQLEADRLASILLRGVRDEDARVTREQYRTVLLIRDLAKWGTAPTGREMPVDRERNNETTEREKA